VLKCLVGDVPLNINFALSEPSLALQPICTFRKFDEYTICIAIITMEFEITNNIQMSASRLRVNPSKTEIMWLGAGYLLQQVDISDIPVPWTPMMLLYRTPCLCVLSSTVRVVQSARDLGVILDSQLLTLLRCVGLASINCDRSDQLSGH